MYCKQQSKRIVNSGTRSTFAVSRNRIPGDQDTRFAIPFNNAMRSADRERNKCSRDSAAAEGASSARLIDLSLSLSHLTPSIRETTRCTQRTADTRRACSNAIPYVREAPPFVFHPWVALRRGNRYLDVYRFAARDFSVTSASPGPGRFLISPKSKHLVTAPSRRALSSLADFDFGLPPLGRSPRLIY